jgi:hypothetical protein
MEIKWAIEKVKVTGDTNIVTQVYWRCEATQEDANASCAGVRELVLGDTFTAYDQLTEQQVLDWCFTPEKIELKDVDGNVVETVIKDTKAIAEAEVTNLINQILLQKTAEPSLPWII